MEAYIISPTTFATLASATAPSYALCTDSVDDVPGSIRLAVHASTEWVGAWILIDGALYIINGVQPGDGDSTLTLRSPLAALSRRILYQPPPEGWGCADLAAAVLTEHYLNCPDPAYAMPYLEIVNNAPGGDYLTPELDSGGLYRLDEYLRTIRRAYGITLTASLTATGLALSLSRRTPLSLYALTGDGHHSLLSADYGGSSVSKVSVLQGGDATDYYLQHDGSVSTSVPSPRIRGKWEIVSISDTADAYEAALKKISGGTSACKIELLCDRAYTVLDNLTLRFWGQTVTAPVSRVERRSEEPGWYRITLGDLPTTLSDKLRQTTSTADTAAAGSSDTPKHVSYRTVTRTQSQSMWDSLRYVAINHAWRSVREWYQSHGFTARYNVAGIGPDTRSAARISVPSLALEGSASELILRMRIYLANGVDTLRWAVSTSGNNAAYEGVGDPGTDTGRVATGTITIPDTGGGYIWHNWTLPCDVPATSPLYIYLWADKSAYGNIHIIDTITVSVTDRIPITEE